MPDFHDVRLPDNVERGAQGGPRFNTTVTEFASGEEHRNKNWSQTRGQWDLSYGIQDIIDIGAVQTFFYAREGRAHGFRFKDWSDFNIGLGTSSGQTIGAGDTVEVAFQVFKRYSDSANTFDRTIKKIVSGTVQVFLDTVLQADPADYSIDLSTGIVTFTSAPGAAAVVSIICEFDVPVRFEQDGLDIQMETAQNGIVPAIPVIELRR